MNQTIGYFVHRPDEFGNAPHLTSPYGHAIAKVFTSRAAARGERGRLRPDERLYRVVLDDEDESVETDESHDTCCDQAYTTVHGQAGQHQPWCVNK